MKITRIFDILQNYKASNNFKNDALVGNNSGKWVYYSTDQYINLSNQFSLGLLSLGIKKSDRIAVISNNRPEWNIIDMGMLQLGCVSVPLFPTAAKEEVQYILKHAAPKFIFVSNKDFYDKVKVILEENNQSVNKIYSFDDIENVNKWTAITDIGRGANEKQVQYFEELKAKILPSDLATIIYTSGTTGFPKGVMLSHHNIVTNFLATSKVYNYGRNDRTLSFIPFSHIYERMLNYNFQYKGLSIYYAQNIKTIVQDLQFSKPQIIICVPSILELIYQRMVDKGTELPIHKRIIYFGAIRLASIFEFNKGFIYKFLLRIADRLVYRFWREALGGQIGMIVIGGSSVQLKLARIFTAAGIEIIEGYGLTETSPVVSVNKPATREVMLGTVGPVLENIEVKLAEDGEILCKGQCIMQGYHKQPILNMQVIDSEGWFHTGDIGYFVDGKYLKIIDRKQDIFKLSNGSSVAPQPIENSIKESDFIQNAMVVGENHDYVGALIVPNIQFITNWASKKKQDVYNIKNLLKSSIVKEQYRKEIDKINKKLKKHKQIKKYILLPNEWTIDSGELAYTMKLKRNKIAEKYKNEIEQLFIN